MRYLCTLLLVLLVSDARGQAWPTTTWDALCVRGGAGGVWNATPIAHVTPSNDPVPCAGDFATVAAFAESDLSAASVWLQGLGFAAPLENRRGPGNPYIFFVGADVVQSMGNNVEGVYRSYDGGLLIVNSQILSTNSAGLQPLKGTAVHEMVHALQASTPFWTAQGQNNDQTWIKEGTAQAIEAEWMRRQHGVGGLGPEGYVRSYSLHAFDRSLHKPAPGSDDEYSAAQFWLGVGEILGSPDRVGYIKEVLASASGGDGGVSGVDAALKTMHPRGLHYLYPEFIARWTADLGDSPQFHANPTAVKLTSTGVERRASAGALPSLATFPFEVDATLPADGRVYQLTIEIEDDQDNLHLIVGDQVIRTGTYTRTFSAPIVGLNVRVANVAPEAAETEATSFTLMLTVDEAGCVSNTGPYAASFSVTDSGPAIGGGHSFTVPLAPEVETVLGAEQDYYHGLSITRSSFMGTSVTWSQAAADESREGVRAMQALIREKGWENLKPEQLRRRLFSLSPEEQARLFDTDEDAVPPGVLPSIGDVLGRAVAFSMPLEGKSGPFSASFLDGDRGASVMLGLFVVGDLRPGTYTHEQGASVGIQAPAFASGGMAEGIQLYQPTITIIDVDPNGCVMGTFEGPYAIRPGEPHTVSGSFQVVVPPEAPVAEF